MHRSEAADITATGGGTPEATAPRAQRAGITDFVRLARPQQWVKSVFCLFGPAYGWNDIRETGADLTSVALAAGLCCVAFALASSATYVVNDLMDAEADRLHPRKRNRPIAAGRVGRSAAIVFAACLLAGGVAAAIAVPSEQRWWVLIAVGAHVANVTLYSTAIKHASIADVMSLSMGFVLRVVGGCLAVGITPSIWLLNVTFFLSMFLAFGKRLGERRTLEGGPDGDPSIATRHRKVQEAYSDTFLQMAVVVTGVTTLVTYAFYIQNKPHIETAGFSVLWLTMLPSTYGLLRAIVCVERGLYDDPTELAYKDRPFQFAGFLFVALTAAVLAGG